MKPATKIKPVKLDMAQQEKFRNQILIVLADYQSTVPSSCHKCFRPFMALDVQPNPEMPKCPECGADEYAWARREGVRTEVADRIMNNLRIVAEMTF